MSETTERWGSRRAFILAVTGAAVGLGNIWRFPYMTGENGGSAFLLLYIGFVLLLGLPVMMAEIMIGRAGRRGPMQALAHLAVSGGRTPHWRWLGLFGAITMFFILSFYSVVSGWSIEYLVDSLKGDFSGMSPPEIGASFAAFLEDPVTMTFNHTVFMLMTMSVVAAGISSGLERLNNLMMPLLYVLLLALAGYSISTPGFGPALSWLFMPNPSAITLDVILNAMGHAFFTLAVGACALMAYGAYMPERQSLPTAAIAVAALDIGVALLAGIAIFAAVFSQGMDPASGPGLMFVSLPIAFANLPGGSVLLALFFLLLLLATWTSSINIAEPIVEVLEGWGLKRRHAALVVGVSVWAMGLLSVLSFSSLKDVHVLGEMNVFDAVTTIPPDFFLPIGGLLIAIFAAWVMPQNRALAGLGTSRGFFRTWRWVLRWISIPLVVVVLGWSFFK
ncbi:sodium-dependent transporter [Cobetia sp. cqz5-12]|uniref:sodium-dependent transporter n=1 Tax=Cobetia sp. cqz5-12 TaxID=2609415 RepID=UPI001908EAAE|nr:sodium-dependent transporter [Cobetia sp. cqz5-12]QQK65590.1 sodium-dependent transporter [Cobetia sp. cqz5-12]